MLDSSVPNEAKDALVDENMRTHLAEALADTSVEKIISALKAELASYGSDTIKKDKPWKVE